MTREEAIKSLKSKMDDSIDTKMEMGDTISRKKLIDEYNKYMIEIPLLQRGRGKTSCLGLAVAMEIAKRLPSVEIEKKKGKWRDTGSGEECSCCGEIQYGYDNFRFYCAHCGAEMEERDYMWSIR